MGISCLCVTCVEVRLYMCVCVCVCVCVGAGVLGACICVNKEERKIMKKVWWWKKMRERARGGKLEREGEREGGRERAREGNFYQDPQSMAWSLMQMAWPQQKA